tara:strand:- start:5487 stop:6242 length:756 start_codon:yes stop_codon:yes gene_type:complete
VKHFLTKLLLLLALPSTLLAAPVTWQTLEPGLEYTQLPITDMNTKGKLHAFQFDLNNYRMNMVFASDDQSSGASVKKLGKQSNAVVAINGGFFTPEHTPLGLRVQNGKIKNPLKRTSWWGVFYVKNNKAHIVPQRDYRNDPKIQFAVQAGPRLVVNRRIPRLKGGYDERSALCITEDKHIVIAVTEHAPITTTHLAKILQRPEKDGGLGCRYALNLDGGSSSQLYAKAGKFSLSVPNFAQVTDAIVVKHRR